MASFLRGHVAAFETFNGLSRVILYDNLKTAVLERAGDAIRFHPTMLALAAHYRFEPRPVAIARGNEKDHASHCTSSNLCVNVSKKVLLRSGFDNFLRLSINAIFGILYKRHLPSVYESMAS